MPIYEYRCDSCGHELEKIQKFSDAVLTDCPKCGKADLKKLMSAAAFQLKGEGWYVTDFKNPKKEQSSELATATATETVSAEPKKTVDVKESTVGSEQNKQSS